MPVIGARGRAGKSSREQAKSREQRAEQAKNQVEVKQAVNDVKQAINEVQQIADTLKQSKQTANSYTEEVKPVTFKPVVYIQNHIPKETNYGWLGELALAIFAIILLLGKLQGLKKNNNTDQLISNIIIIIAASIIIFLVLASFVRRFDFNYKW